MFSQSSKEQQRRIIVLILFLFLLETLKLCYVSVLPACVYAHCVHEVPMGKWSDGKLWAAMWVLRTELWSSARASSALTCWASSPASERKRVVTWWAPHEVKLNISSMALTTLRLTQGGRIEAGMYLMLSLIIVSYISMGSFRSSHLPLLEHTRF